MEELKLQLAVALLEIDMAEAVYLNDQLGYLGITASYYSFMDERVFGKFVVRMPKNCHCLTIL